jgi:required for meiotic nuclear division protein 1
VRGVLNGRMPSGGATTLEAKAVLLGERIDTRGFEPAGAFSQFPLAFRSNEAVVVVYRFGALVFFNASLQDQERIVAQVLPRVIEPAAPVETEVASVTFGAAEDGVSTTGKITLVDLSEHRLLVIADALAKSVALADDERYVAKVFERIEPLAQQLAATGGTPLSTKGLHKVLGEALVAQSRMVGRVEVEEKPDLLWEQSQLQRLHAKLSDEYELEERARALSRKLKVIEESAATLADVTQSRHALRLEIAIVALIAFEIVLSFWRH